MSRMTDQAFVDFDVLITNTVLIAQDLLNDIIGQINTIETFIPEKEYFWNLQLTSLSLDITKFVELTTMMAKILTNRKNITLPEI